MNDLMSLQFEGRGVRIIMRDGEPWWIAKDVADILGYSDAQAMTRRLDEDETMTDKLSVMTMKSIFINESGLYNAIIGSRKPEAKRFRKWVTSEVLPQIRKTGSYGVQKQLTPTELALMVIESEKQKALLENKLGKAEKRIEVMSEHDQIVKQFMACDGLLSFDEVAKIARIRQKRFYRILKGVVHKNNGQVYANLVATGKVELKPIIRGNKIQTEEFFTPQGAIWFYRKYLRKNDDIIIENLSLDF